MHAEANSVAGLRCRTDQVVLVYRRRRRRLQGDLFCELRALSACIIMRSIAYSLLYLFTESN
jgi:hypothetical protein